jgi:hypothetical protein
MIYGFPTHRRDDAGCAVRHSVPVAPRHSTSVCEGRTNRGAVAEVRVTENNCKRRPLLTVASTDRASDSVQRGLPTCYVPSPALISVKLVTKQQQIPSSYTAVGWVRRVEVPFSEVWEEVFLAILTI